MAPYDRMEGNARLTEEANLDASRALAEDTHRRSITPCRQREATPSKVGRSPCRTRAATLPSRHDSTGDNIAHVPTHHSSPHESVSTTTYNSIAHPAHLSQSFRLNPPPAPPTPHKHQLPSRKPRRSSHGSRLCATYGADPPTRESPDESTDSEGKDETDLTILGCHFPSPHGRDLISLALQQVPAGGVRLWLILGLETCEIQEARLQKIPNVEESSIQDPFIFFNCA